MAHRTTDKRLITAIISIYQPLFIISLVRWDSVIKHVVPDVNFDTIYSRASQFLDLQLLSRIIKMRPAWWPGEEHELFTQWAVSQGIIVNGVGPAKFPGRGLGMIAKRSIQVRDRMSRICEVFRILRSAHRKMRQL